jgi:tripartite-type tricarboxylate transporter receptor subunit TctC
MKEEFDLNIRPIAILCLSATVIAACGTSARSTPAATWTPSQTIHINSVLPAGSNIDSNTRALVAGTVSVNSFPVSLQVDDLAGSGPPGVAQVVAGRPDGYMLGVSSTGPLEVSPLLSQNASLPFHSPDDYTPIMTFAYTPFWLAVPSSSPLKTLDDFIGTGKTKPGSIRYGFGGALGSIGHLLVSSAGLKNGATFTAVPFTGSGPAVTALLGRQIDAMATDPNTLFQYVQKGDVRILGVWEKQRDKKLPDVPTFMELKYDTLILSSTFTLFAPKGTPDPVVQTLYVGFKKGAESQSFQTFVQTAGESSLVQDPATTKATMKTNAKALQQLVKSLNL